MRSNAFIKNWQESNKYLKLFITKYNWRIMNMVSIVCDGFACLFVGTLYKKSINYEEILEFGLRSLISVDFKMAWKKGAVI